MKNLLNCLHAYLFDLVGRHTLLLHLNHEINPQVGLLETILKGSLNHALSKGLCLAEIFCVFDVKPPEVGIQCVVWQKALKVELDVVEVSISEFRQSFAQKIEHLRDVLVLLHVSQRCVKLSFKRFVQGQLFKSLLVSCLDFG